MYCCGGQVDVDVGTDSNLEDVVWIMIQPRANEKGQR